MINQTAKHHVQEHCTPDTTTRTVYPKQNCTESQPQYYLEVGGHIHTVEILLAVKETPEPIV
jgi:hypothetical protein